MVLEWVDEEDKELNKYEPYRIQNQSNNGSKGKNSNNRPNNNYSGTPNRKRKPNNTVAAMERTPQSKSKKNSDSPSFKELLKK